MRIYLAGRIAIESAGTLFTAAEFPGQQARLAFACLVLERSRPVSRAELAEVLWPTALPPSWETALSAVISRLRALLTRVGLDGSSALVSAAGCYELYLPSDCWVDVEAAIDAIHEAEAALMADDPPRAYGPSAVAQHIARRPFFAGEEAPWVEQRRERLRSVLVRALECRARIYLWNGEYALAAEAARDATTIAPFRESGYRLLMEAHAAAGNSAEALWVYEKCRSLIAEELGVLPSRETRAIYERLLQRL